MVFIGLFFGLFHYRICSSGIAMSLSFPLIISFSFGIPFSNLLLLLFTTFPIQGLQLFITIGLLHQFIEGLAHSICCSIMFLVMQLQEFLYSYCTISDSVFGSINYSISGLHGLHVLIGSLGFYIIFSNLFMDAHNLNIFIQCPLSINLAINVHMPLPSLYQLQLAQQHELFYYYPIKHAHSLYYGISHGISFNSNSIIKYSTISIICIVLSH